MARGKLMMPLLVISDSDRLIIVESIETGSRKYPGIREVDDRPRSRDLFHLFNTLRLSKMEKGWKNKFFTFLAIFETLSLHSLSIFVDKDSSYITEKKVLT